MDLRPDHRFNHFSQDADDLPPLPDDFMQNVDFNDPASFIKALGGGPGTNLPIPRLVSPEDARHEATKRSGLIFECLDTLHAILERHEATIQNRWTKKTKQQRRNILLNAWPDLPASHRPDFDAFRKESPQQREADTRYRDSFIWPYLNQEDLTRPRTLPMLLNTRGRNHPSQFAAADSEAMYLGRITKAIVPVFLNCYVVVLNGILDRKADRDYGKLLHWDDHPDAFSWMHTRQQFLPGEALLVLEAQERLMTFLVKCCELILHDIPASLLTNESYPIQSEAMLKSENDMSGYASLSVMAAEAPYRLPSKLDTSRIVSLLSAATVAKEDHVWSLREDPGYFCQCVLERSEHRQEMIIDTRGKKHPVFHPTREDVYWNRVVGDVVTEAYIELEVFYALLQEAQSLRNIQIKHNGRISPDEMLPDDYLDALLKFRFYLNQAAKGPLNMLKQKVAASLPFRTFFVRTPPDAPTSSRIQVQSNGLKMGSIQMQLLWLLQTLWEDKQELYFLRMTLVVDELQRLIDTEPKAKEMISEHLSSIIADLAIICECMRQLDIFQPWALTFESHMVEKEDGIKKQYLRTSQPWAGLLNALKESSANAMGQLGRPTETNFNYPVWKRRTKENTEIMQRSEANLDAFWRHIDKITSNKAIDSTGVALKKLLTQPRILQRTPPWFEPQKSETRSSEKSVEFLEKPLSELYLELESRTSKTLSSSSVQGPKSKVKTRGVVQRASPIAPATEPGANPADPQPTFSVDSRALKVFRTLFFLPSISAMPGEIAWNDFVHAMISTGFDAEKLYGSVWHFMPKTLDVERSIQFHEPHPSGKIPFRVARRHGRRLHRAYGWHGSMFVLQEKRTTEPTS